MRWVTGKGDLIPYSNQKLSTLIYILGFSLRFCLGFKCRLLLKQTQITPHFELLTL